MFKNCYSLTSVVLPKFDTSNIINMSSMFESCGKLTFLDLTHFTTNRVTDMSNMFNNCTSLETIKLNFNTEKVEKMGYMFGSCLKLTSLDITTFNTGKCNNFTNMFENDENLNLYLNYEICNNLKGQIPSFVKVHDISEN